MKRMHDDGEEEVLYMTMCRARAIPSSSTFMMRKWASAVKQGHAVNAQGECEPDINVFPHTRAAVPAEKLRKRTRLDGNVFA